MRIRSATDDDVDAVVELWELAGGPARSPGRHAEARALLRRDPEALIVAEHDTRIVGTVIVGWNGWRCHLYRLAGDHAGFALDDDDARWSSVPAAPSGDSP